MGASETVTKPDEGWRLKRSAKILELRLKTDRKNRTAMKFDHRLQHDSTGLCVAIQILGSGMSEMIG